MLIALKSSAYCDETLKKAAFAYYAWLVTSKGQIRSMRVCFWIMASVFMLWGLFLMGCCEQVIAGVFVLAAGIWFLHRGCSTPWKGMDAQYLALLKSLPDYDRPRSFVLNDEGLEECIEGVYRQFLSWELITDVIVIREAFVLISGKVLRQHLERGWFTPEQESELTDFLHSKGIPFAKEGRV